jgi:amino acid permease
MDAEKGEKSDANSAASVDVDEVKSNSLSSEPVESVKSAAHRGLRMRHVQLIAISSSVGCERYEVRAKTSRVVLTASAVY